MGSLDKAIEAVTEGGPTPAPGDALRNVVGGDAPQAEVVTEGAAPFDPQGYWEAQLDQGIESPSSPRFPGSPGSTDVGLLTRGLKTGGGPKREQELSGTISGTIPPEVANAKRIADQRLAMSQQLQLEARLMGLGQMANVGDDLANELGEVTGDTMKDVNRLASEAEAQMYVAQEMIDAARSNRINPGQFYVNVGDAGTFSSSIAVAAGYMAATSLGGVNLAGQIIDQAIARNVRAQEMNQLHDTNMVKAQLTFADKLRQLGVDRGNIGNLHQTMLIAMTQAQLDSIKAATASLETRAQIDQLWAGLDARYWESVSAYFENIKANFRVKYSSLADGIRQARNVVAAGNTFIEAAGGVPVSAPPPAGAGGAPQLGRPAAGGKSGVRRGRSVEPQGLAATGEQPTQSAATAKWSADEPAIRDIQRNAPKDPAGAQAYIEQRLRENPELQGYPIEAMVPIELARDKGWARKINTGKNKDFEVLTKDSFRRGSEKYQETAIKRVQARGRVVALSEEAGQILQETGWTKWVNTGGKGSFFSSITPEGREKFNELKGVFEEMANMVRTEGGSDAIRAVSEWKIWLRLVGATGLQPIETVDDVAERIEQIGRSLFRGDKSAEATMRRWGAGYRVLLRRFDSEFDQHFFSEATLFQKIGNAPPSKAGEF